MKVAIYIRVSTEDQVQEGYSLDGQKDRILNFCDIQNYDVYGIYIEEGISGKNIKDRPQINDLIKDAKSKMFDSVLVYKLDRLGRNTRELLEIHDVLNEYNITIISLSENIDTRTPQGKLVFTMLAAFAEMELSTIAERTTLGKEQKVRSGKYLNGPRTLFGYEYVDDHLRQNPHEAEYVRQMFRWIKDGASIREITRRMNNLGVKTYSGSTSWSKSTITKMLKNPTYAGYLRYNSKRNGEIISEAENVDAIISKKEFDDAQTILNARSSDSTRKHARTSYYFADVLYCAECGRKMITTVSFAKQGDKRVNYQYYRCSNKYRVINDIRRCNKSVSTSQLKLLRMFWKYIENIALPKANPEVVKEKRNWDLEIQDIDNQIEKTTKRKSSLLKKFLDDLVPQDIYKQTLNDLIKETESLEKTKQSLIEQKNSTNDNSAVSSFILSSMKDFKSSFEKLTDNQKRFFITKSIKKIYINSTEVTSIEFN